MSVVNVHAAKTHLSRLIQRGCAGEEIVIARNNEPVVKLVPIAAPVVKRRGSAARWRGRSGGSREAGVLTEGVT